MKIVMRQVRYLLISLVSFAPILAAGCSVIGYSIGSAVDNRKSDYRMISERNYTQVHPGDIISLLYRDGSKIRGAYLGVAASADSNYQELLNAAGAVTDLEIPTLGENVFVSFANGTAAEAAFCGFDYAFPDLALFPAILLKFSDRDTAVAVNLAILREISKFDRYTLRAVQIDSALAAGILPSRTVLVIDTGAIEKMRISGESLRSDTLLQRQLQGAKARLLAIATNSDSLVSLENYETNVQVVSERICFKADQGRRNCESLENLKFIDIELPGHSVLRTEVALSEIAGIRISQSRHAAITGLVVGLGLDLSLIVIGIAVGSTMEMNMSFGS